MELIHANSSLIEQQIFMNYELDMVSGLGTEYSDNDFELTIPENDWLKLPITAGHFIYELNSEHGGRVEGIEHVGSDIKLTGPTWRGMLARKIVKPPGGSAYLTITAAEANAAIGDLIGTSLGNLFTVSTGNSGITVSGSFRYDNLLSAINTMLDDSAARLNVTFDGTNVILSAALVVDYSKTNEMSQDWSAPIQSAVNSGEAYNHVIALGIGELTARTVVEYYRHADGTINTTPLADGIDDLQYVLDYPNAESTDELIKAAKAKLKELLPTEKIEIDLSEAQGLKLGDIVGGRDYVTGMSIKKPITQIILTVDSDGEKYEYKVGE